MRHLIPFLLLLGLSLVAVGNGPEQVGTLMCERCLEARETNGWCDPCAVGWVGDVRLRSRYLWHVLDAHGHRLELEKLDCVGCAQAYLDDGFCEESKIGFLDGEAYFSRLTWLLASAGRREELPTACSVCGDGRHREGWCETCSRGWVGRRFLRDRERFEMLRHDLEILRIAAEASVRCEHCAAAIVTDSRCPRCKTRYRAGRALLGGGPP